jgi:hypothetical protein
MPRKFNNSSLILKKRGKDKNGNQTVQLAAKGERGFSIQTNGNLPKTHSYLQGLNKFTHLSDEQMNEIEKEVVDYVSAHGTKNQKRLIDLAGAEKMAKGGIVQIGDYLKYPKATMVGEVIAIGTDSAIPDQKTVTIRYEDGKQVSDLLSSFEVVDKKPVKKMAKGGMIHYYDKEGSPLKKGDKVVIVDKWVLKDSNAKSNYGIIESFDNSTENRILEVRMNDGSLKAFGDSETTKLYAKGGEINHFEIQERLKSAGIPANTGDRIEAVEHLEIEHFIDPSVIVRALSDDKVYGAIKSVANDYELDLDDVDMSTGSRESVMEELSENQGFGYPELFRAMSDDDVFGAVHYVAINHELLEEPKEDVKKKFMNVTYIELAQGGFEVPRDSMHKVSYGFFDSEEEARDHIESDLEAEERKIALAAKKKEGEKRKEELKKKIEAENEKARKRIEAKKEAKLKKELKEEMKALFNTYAGNYSYKPTAEFKSHIMREMSVGDAHQKHLEGIYTELIKEYRDAGELYEQGGKIKGRKKGCFEGHLSFLNW